MPCRCSETFSRESGNLRSQCILAIGGWESDRQVGGKPLQLEARRAAFFWCFAITNLESIVLHMARGRRLSEKLATLASGMPWRYWSTVSRLLGGTSTRCQKQSASLRKKHPTCREKRREKSIQKQFVARCGISMCQTRPCDFCKFRNHFPISLKRWLSFPGRLR